MTSFLKDRKIGRSFVTDNHNHLEPFCNTVIAGRMSKDKKEPLIDGKSKKVNR